MNSTKILLAVIALSLALGIAFTAATLQADSQDDFSFSAEGSVEPASSEESSQESERTVRRPTAREELFSANEIGKSAEAGDGAKAATIEEAPEKKRNDPEVLASIKGWWLERSQGLQGEIARAAAAGANDEELEAVMTRFRRDIETRYDEAEGELGNR